jgi:hypothetical protein
MPNAYGENGTDGTKKFLMKTQVSEDFA